MEKLNEDIYMRNNIRENERMEIKNCPFCGSERKKLFLNLDKFYYVKCQNCNLVFQELQPEFEHLKNRYDEKYFEYEIKNHQNFHHLQRLTLKDIDFENRFAPLKGKKVLDIGSATGLLLRYFKDLGMEELGIELCKESAEFAKTNFEVNVINDTLENAKLPSNYYDIIHFSHLIEHLKDPMSFLFEVKRILKPGGSIIITTPRLDSPAFYIYKKSWRSAIPDHLVLFTKKTIINMLKKTGFNPYFQESWGFIPVGFKYKKIKKLVDVLAKKFNFGDVMCIVAEKIDN
ncbi:MAG: methyltransferase domain-containing protein [Spirochaetes bacterium]|nr:methyltransferase domain-containing protein [Spirochaetota bacterium]